MRWIYDLNLLCFIKMCSGEGLEPLRCEFWPTKIAPFLTCCLCIKLTQEGLGRRTMTTGAKARTTPSDGSVRCSERPQQLCVLHICGPNDIR